MSIDAFIPELWSAKINQVLENSLVAQQVCSTDYAGEIKSKGDTVHIMAATAVSTDDYHTTNNITYEEATLTDTELTIDTDKYFALKIEDADKIQANSAWQQVFAANGAYQLKDDIDALIMAQYANAGLDSYETGTTEWTLGTDASGVPVMLAALNKQLNTANAPMTGRYIIAPPILVEAFQVYTANRATALGDSALVNGYMGKLGGFDIYMSNNCTSAASVTHGLVGVKGHSIAYAQQVDPNSIENVGRAEGRFADLIRGRVLCGYKVFRSATLIDLNLADTLLA